MSVRLSLAAVVVAAGAILPRAHLPVASTAPPSERIPVEVSLNQAADSGAVSQAARQAAVSQPARQGGTTTLEDQTELAVTVYNSDIALVRDVRSITLARGTSGSGNRGEPGQWTSQCWP